MATQPKPARPARKSEYGTLVVLAAINIGFLLVYVINVFVDRTFHTDLSPAIPGGLTFEVTQGSGFTLLMIGFLVKALSLLGVVVALTMLLRQLLNANLYTKRSITYIRVAAWALIGWIVGVFIENMGNNMAAAHLGVDDQWNGSTASGTSITLMFFLVLFTLHMFERVMQESITMHEEVEDLV